MIAVGTKSPSVSPWLAMRVSWSVSVAWAEVTAAPKSFVTIELIAFAASVL